MSRAAGLLNKLNGALNRVGPGDRNVYKRVVTRSGGDDLIGRPGTVTHTDTLLSPQPTYSRVTRYVVGEHVYEQFLVDSKGQTQAAVDYMFVFSASSITKTELSNENLSLVVKDSSGNEEEYRITDVEPVALNGVDILFITYAKSTSQP